MVEVRNISSWSNDKVQYTSLWTEDPWVLACKFLASPSRINEMRINIHKLLEISLNFKIKSCHLHLFWNIKMSTTGSSFKWSCKIRNEVRIDSSTIRTNKLCLNVYVQSLTYFNFHSFQYTNFISFVSHISTTYIHAMMKNGTGIWHKVVLWPQICG